MIRPAAMSHSNCRGKSAPYGYGTMLSRPRVFLPGPSLNGPPAEQGELVDFLRALCGTKAKVLLTSRRGEHAWLGDLPVRVTMPPMPTLERLELAGAIAERYG